MILEQLQLELSIETNEVSETLIRNYANLIKANNKLTDWLSVNNKIIDKYGEDVLETIKFEAWIIVNDKNIDL